MRSIEAAIVEAALGAIIACDESGLVRSFNPAAEKIFGYAASEMLGRNVNQLMPSPDHVGIAVYPLHGQAYDDILRCADDALYRAKRAGRGRFELFGAAT